LVPLSTQGSLKNSSPGDDHTVAPGLFAFRGAVVNEAQANRAGDDEDGVHRLRDIVVEEVSLVDRAANKRRFLVVKRSEDMADDETKPKDEATPARGAKGKKKRAEDTKKAKRRSAAAAEDEAEKARQIDDEEDETEKADRAADEDEDDEEETRKADDEEDADSEDEETSKAATRKKPGDADEEDEPAPAKKADDDDDDAALVLPVGVKNTVLRVLASALERLIAVANRVKEADEPDDDTEPNVPDDLGEELEDIGELLEDVGDRFDGTTEKRGVKKAGARMAKDRLDRFQKALALLSEVLKELTDAKQKPTEPSAGAAEDRLQKRAPAGMEQLVAGIGELTRVVKRQEEELTRIRKARGVSNAIPVDGGRREPAQEVSWPLDMNRPISRDSVAKAVSFYEE
jgi:hypothetical protein